MMIRLFLSRKLVPLGNLPFLSRKFYDNSSEFCSWLFILIAHMTPFFFFV